MRQLAINPHSINWTALSPPVINTQTIQLTLSLCGVAVWGVFWMGGGCFLYCYSNVPPRHCILQILLPNCSESSVSLLCPIRNTKYTFRLLRGRGYRCLCVQPQHTDWRQNATILQKQSLIIWLRCSSEKTWLPLLAEVRFSSAWPAHVCMHMNAVCAYTVWIHTYGHRDVA